MCSRCRCTARSAWCAWFRWPRAGDRQPRPACCMRRSARRSADLAPERIRRHIAARTAARGLNMTYVVTETCIRCKYMDCIEVCPVDCFYVGENMLVIHPDECIDCGVCEPECPVEAIVPDSDDKATDWLEQNRTYA